ncbi:MAG TPA: hypothetical protein VFM05_00810 [Candidatus Saccharimonadales bacterium]|nr:hypothetical protein [Candidatus Saccharimonadales bacterium]
MKRLTSHLLEPRSIILGFTTFYFSSTLSMWIDDPFWQYHREIFVATVLLISAVSLAMNSVWSNLLAAVLSGQFPFVFLAEFWMLSKNAEVTTFGFKHIQIWWWEMSHLGLTPFLLFTVSTVILSLSIVSHMRFPQLRWMDELGQPGEEVGPVA